jgi:membrane-bound lytic murein transglycosylase D
MLPERIIESRKDRFSGEKIPEIPGFDHSLTKHWIEYYTSKGRLGWLSSTLIKGEPYLDFIRQEIKLRELPPELLYLPVIESGFSVTARSSSGARGLWQFMRNSMHPYMKSNEWVDERLDFWKSTHGALSKLESHFKEFGNWPLALAAYNSGGGAISKILKNTGTKDYWHLAETRKLKTESVHYVPKLLAVYYIASNPRKFNLDICRPSKEYEWTRVPVSKQVNMAVLAEYSGIENTVLHNANRELLTPLTPPGGYSLKVRAGDAAAVKAVLDSEDLKLIKHYIYIVRPGDTLFALARHYGVSVDNIMAENPGINPKSLKLGSRIIIPAFKEVSSPPAPPATAALPPKNSGQEWAGTWTVRSGDTLWSISRKYNVSAESLAFENNISLSSVLSVGKVLRVPLD